MDMRFPGLDLDSERAGTIAAAINYHCFVAVLAAGQIVTPAARAAAQARSARSDTTKRTPEALLGALDSVSSARPAGAFHRAADAAFQGSESKLKSAFTLAFQPSFKPTN